MITIRRGSTPRITCHIPEDIDMTTIANVWLYLAQNLDGRNNKVVVDKTYTKQDIDIDIAERTISIKLSQEDSLALKVGTATIQMRLLFDNEDAKVSQEDTVRVLDAYKEGVMTNEN